MPDLNHAVQLIRQGQNAEAQQILQTIIKADPKNVQAWFWYVETCTTTEKRIQTLEMCLKMNPANVQVTQALQMFRAQQPMSPIQSESVKTELSPASTFLYYEEDQKKEFPSTQNDDRYGYGSYGSSFEPSQAVPLYEGPSALPAMYMCSANRNYPNPPTMNWPCWTPLFLYKRTAGWAVN